MLPEFRGCGRRDTYSNMPQTCKMMITKKESSDFWGKNQMHPRRENAGYAYAWWLVDCDHLCMC